ncbi:MAG: hypothetical protein A3H98_12460 [Bacteroidetes bacterium RIFCSPLOWO2_02_FULL_36_8]|nr:MAG: hypothetical protein A3H98_12460 [Bacteroidetes bacterium RIFCSPLOWO2_02_FULL_36_8]OFY72185.1 MAG: hypothetical protein A3G23_01280 [Bacteroidetes bacterium RIFCSPLOWO2_12_FULL_37_12]
MLFPKFIFRLFFSSLFLFSFVSNRENTSYTLFNSGDISPENTTALPITLKSFTLINVRTNDFLLEWTTASESNNHYFLLERQTDTLTDSWEIVDTVISKAVKGNSTSELNYSYTDKNLPAGTYYYRLVLIALNGNQNIHEKYVWGVIPEYEPIIIQGSSTLWIDKNENFEVYDVMGRKVMEGNTREVNLSGMTRGVYMIKQGKNVTKFRLIFRREN